MPVIRDFSQLNEGQLTHSLFSDLQLYSNAFYFAECTAIGFSRTDWTIEAFIELSRSELGLDPNKKPGDIDVLLIPNYKGDRFAERSVAIEVKRFFVPSEKRGKGPNQFGTTQVKGLVEDGFPLVGLLHLPTIEASSDDNWQPVAFLDTSGAQTSKTMMIDIEAYATTQRNVGRIERLNLPTEIGYHSFAFTMSQNNDAYFGNTLSDYRTPSKNKKTDANIIERIRRLPQNPDYEIFHGLNSNSIKSSLKTIATRHKLGL